MPHDFIREPDRNEYGKLKLLRQTTGKFVIYDPDAKVMGQGLTFKSEEDAHLAISAMTGIAVHRSSARKPRPSGRGGSAVSLCVVMAVLRLCV